MSYAFVLKSKVFLKYFIYPPLPRSEKQREGKGGRSSPITKHQLHQCLTKKAAPYFILVFIFNICSSFKA